MKYSPGPTAKKRSSADGGSSCLDGMLLMAGALPGTGSHGHGNIASNPAVCALSRHGQSAMA